MSTRVAGVNARSDQPAALGEAVDDARDRTGAVARRPSRATALHSPGLTAPEAGGATVAPERRLYGDGTTTAGFARQFGIVVGHSHSCGVSTSGAGYCWGAKTHEHA